MAGHDDYPDNIVVDWCIEAKVHTTGKPHTNEEMGLAGEAVPAMVAWLRSVEQTLPDDAEPKIDITATRTSEQVPGNRVSPMKTRDFPTELAFRYAIDELERIGAGDNWGSGGGP